MIETGYGPRLEPNDPILDNNGIKSFAGVKTKVMATVRIQFEESSWAPEIYIGIPMQY